VGIHAEVRGEGAAAMLLLHGMSATGAVWRGAVAALEGMWEGAIVVCDLPGHGASSQLARYTYDAVATAVTDCLPACERLVVAGHSFGGLIAVHLASGRYGVTPAAVVASSVKVRWTADELAAMAAFASKPSRLFATFDEAQDRYRKVAGLTPDVTDDPLDLARGVAAEGDQFRLSQDPASAGVGEPDMAAALASARCPVLLSRGVTDWMVSDDDLAEFGVPTLTIGEAGHNVHVEQPARFARSLVEFAASVSPAS
jgi:pimeloyl-ACP methyl ester carboxylesterase